MVPSAAIRVWYLKRMRGVVNAMLEDYNARIRETLKDEDVRRFFARDASASSLLRALMSRLQFYWERIFNRFAEETADEFIRRSNEYANASTWHSLSIAGIKAPILAYNMNILNTLGAARNFNHTLITGIQADVHEKIYTAVMLSLTSPNPEEQGESGIFAALRDVGGFAENRMKLIARDQTSKLYTSLSEERMEQNGVEEFEWMHSAAGKVPRPTHVEKDGKIFKLNDPRLWTGPKADQGPPGWAINCRCGKRPII